MADTAPDHGSDDARVRYERPHESVARLVLNRPEVGNAQDKRMIYELNDGFERAAAAIACPGVKQHASRLEPGCSRWR